MHSSANFASARQFPFQLTLVAFAFGLAIAHDAVSVVQVDHSLSQVRSDGIPDAPPKDPVEHKEKRDPPAESPGHLRQSRECNGQSSYTILRSSDDEADGDEDEMNVEVDGCGQEKKLVFLHIPKNAGSTIEDVGHEEGIEWGIFHWSIKNRTTMPDGTTCPSWHAPPRYISGENPYADENTEVFCVTRDPWERILSDYSYWVSVKDKWPVKHITAAPICTEEGLNTWVKLTLADVEAGHRWMTSCHMLPQSDYIEDPPGKKWCDTVIPIGELTDQFNSLMESHNLPLRMNRKSNSATNVCSNIDAKKPTEWLRSENMAAIRRVYAKDFAMLGDSLKEAL